MAVEDPTIPRAGRVRLPQRSPGLSVRTRFAWWAVGGIALRSRVRIARSNRDGLNSVCGNRTPTALDLRVFTEGYRDVLVEPRGPHPDLSNRSDPSLSEGADPAD